MKAKSPSRAVHACGWPVCHQGLPSKIAEEHRAINQLIAALDEKGRRLFAGSWATVSGRGGIERLTVITGLRRTTVRRGKREVQRPMSTHPARIRQPGGGRKRIEKNAPMS